jgi:hypothetical protein
VQECELHKQDGFMARVGEVTISKQNVKIDEFVWRDAI